MSDATQLPVIVLAREPAFALGRLEVRPATREIIAPGFREVLEPRVMQVLVCLARARGQVVARDDLALACWEGRVVGEDAINRVISRLRRLSERDAGASFTLETITKVGYRLVETEAAAAQPPSPAAVAAQPPLAPSTARRYFPASLIVLGLAAGIAAVFGFWQPWRTERIPPPRPQIAEGDRGDLNAARRALNPGTAEDTARAVALLESLVQRAPDWAEAWGLLGIAYLSNIEFVPLKDQDGVSNRARDAANRALQLHAGDPQGNFVLAVMTPNVGHWLEKAQTFDAMVKQDPDSRLYAGLMANFASASGASGTALTWIQRLGLPPGNARAPGAYASTLANVGRIDEGARVLDDAARQWPRNISVFFSRFWFDLFNGRPERALALIEDEPSRPTGIDPQDFDLYRLGALAFVTRQPGDIDTALARNADAGKRGRGYAQNTMRMAAALGRLDLAFKLADALYFDRGEPLGQLAFSAAQGQYAIGRQRPTYVLFDVSTANMRHDPRFVALAEELGLGDYWRKSGRWPDFCADDPAAAAICAKLKAGG